MEWTDPAIIAFCSRHGEADPERLIIRLCDELLAECPTDSGPTPLNVLGSCRGVRQIHRGVIHVAAGCSGILVPKDGGYEITVQSTEPEGRQNFSIAHEIVHTFFREDCPYSQPSAQEEQLCDIGAAELTMPAARFSSYTAARLLCLATVDECHAEFAVTAMAAARRTVALTEVSACLFVARMERTNQQEQFHTGEPKLRITKWWRSSAWPEHRGYRHLRVLPGSVMDQAFVNQDQRAGRGALGIEYRRGIYEVEARGYGYTLPGNPQYRQVLALTRGPFDKAEV